jgi:5'-nucleotidase
MTKIMLDVDGVILDTQSSWLELYNADYNDKLTNADIVGWDLVPFVKPECGNRIYDYLDYPHFYDRTQAIKGSVKGVATLREMGYDVKFVSAGFYPTKIQRLYVLGFLVNFPYGDGRWQTSTDAILANDKSWVNGDLLVDDRPKNLIDFHSGGILFDQPWNQEHKGHHRVFNWIELVDLIKELYG